MIAAQIRAQIVRGELNEGDSLPGEVELMEQFDVSRPTLREAFRILETERLIAIKRGARGGRVLAPSVGVAARYFGFLLQAAGTTIGDLYQARSIIEPAAAGLRQIEVQPPLRAGTHFYSSRTTTGAQVRQAESAS